MASQTQTVAASWGPFLVKATTQVVVVAVCEATELCLTPMMKMVVVMVMSW